MACAARLFHVPEPDDNMLSGNVASTANVRRQAADYFGHLRARAAEFPHHVALHWPPMTTPPLGTRCSWWFASQAPRGRRARLGRADEGAQPPRIAPTNENLRGVGARTAFCAEDGWFRGHSTTTDAWEAFMLRPGDDWDGLGAAPHALSEAIGCSGNEGDLSWVGTAYPAGPSGAEGALCRARGRLVYHRACAGSRGRAAGPTKRPNHAIVGRTKVPRCGYLSRMAL